MKHTAWVFVAALAALSCSSVKNMVEMDIPLEQQEQIKDEYHNREAWTRLVITDLGDHGSILRDEKVVITDVGLSYRGSVTIRTLKKKNKVVHGLELDSPLTKERVEARLAELFWFDDPTTRHVAFIRQYGKKTAKAIMEHDLFAGMPADAALASWGPPARKQVTELQGVVNERWIYPTGTPNKTKSLDLKDGKVFRWDE